MGQLKKADTKKRQQKRNRPAQTEKKPNNESQHRIREMMTTYGTVKLNRKTNTKRVNE